MSKGTHRGKDDSIGRPPLVSAADVAPANYPRAHFDESIGWFVRDTGKRRAPTPTSVRRHRIGFAGELAAAAYFGAEANTTITDDFVGDDGFDFRYRGSPVEVKTTANETDWELAVPIDKVDSADYFVLGHCSAPSELVQLIGYAPRWRLELVGHRFDGKLRLPVEHLYPLRPLELFPPRIRKTQNVPPR